MKEDQKRENKVGEREEIKTLANCSEVEFLRQTNRIRKSVEKWLTITEIKKIRSNVPEYEEIPENASAEEAERIIEKNKAKTREQGLKNLDLILDAALEEHPEETAEVIKLCCFVDPKTESKSMIYYMKAFTEMLQDEAVIDFFQLLAQLVRTSGLTL